MSRYYEMRLRIDRFPTVLVETIKTVANEHWDFSDWLVGRDLPGESRLHGVTFLETSGTGFLAGGESEEEFVYKLTHTLWDVCKCYLRIEVTTIYLDNPPTEVYELDKDAYVMWRARKDKECQ